MSRRQDGSQRLVEAVLARAVLDLLYCEMAKRRGEGYCPIFLDSAKDFAYASRRIEKSLKALRSTRRIKQCIKKLEKMIEKF